MKRGTRIEVRGSDINFKDTWEAGTILRRVTMTHYADGSDYPGWHHVKFAADGAVLTVHENNMRVVDNRA